MRLKAAKEATPMVRAARKMNLGVFMVLGLVMVVVVVAVERPVLCEWWDGVGRGGVSKLQSL